jgi:hypothetical protein
MRDVYITRIPGGDGFRAVWTWAWKGSTLGTASSADLLTWSHQTEVTIMQGVPVRNVWAPETYWDAKANGWLLIWSSAPSDNDSGNRIWASHTKDFASYSQPVVIDATMFRRKYDVVFGVCAGPKCGDARAVAAGGVHAGAGCGRDVRGEVGREALH